MIFGCKDSNNSQNNLLDQETDIKKQVQSKASEALEFCKENNFNTDFCILIDMSIHSGKNRMYIYNFNKNEIERTALCAHGSGKGNKKSTGANPIFGNDEGSFLHHSENIKLVPVRTVNLVFTYIINFMD